jgi:uncharacterized repeat protein (TIGR03806 family)
MAAHIRESISSGAGQRLAGAMLFALIAISTHAQPYGIDARAPNTELAITELPDAVPAAMDAVRVFPDLSFNYAVLLVNLVDSADDSERLFLVSQNGEILVFPNIPNPAPGDVSTFLDISGRVLNSGEQGLLGLAFAPDYFTNGRCYVYYTAKDSPRRSVVSRFTAANPRANSISNAGEEVILEVNQPFTNHNGGMIGFGPDGFLYIALGDGGSGGDPQGHGQNTETLLGSILRIDVEGAPDPGLAYAIPSGNPFVASPPTPGSRKEIYAYGLRNPYRFSFDSSTGILYAADVGQNRWEEVDIIEKGRNYGWNIMEANHEYPPDSPFPDTTGLTLPIAEYSHAGNGGRASVTGGYVYYGTEVPSLYGWYVFGDYISHKIFGVQYDGNTASALQTLANTAITVTGFGQDASGEVYILDYFGGIYVLRPQTPGGGSTFPARLSDMPALLAAGSGQGHTIGGVIPYEPSAKLWSDGAGKERYIALPDFDFAGPDYAQIGYRQAGGWDFPDNSVLIKNFFLPNVAGLAPGQVKRVETRLLYKNSGEWHGFSYEWNDQETDAVLLTAGKKKPVPLVGDSEFYWTYPGRNDCAACHTAVVNRVLGPNTPQMNFDFPFPASGVTDNQLRTYDHIGLFSSPLPGSPETLPRMPDPVNESASLRDRSRAYLAANCAFCHQPGATAPATIDLRWETSDDGMNSIGFRPERGDLGIPGAQIVSPGFPQQSILLERMKTLDPDFRMPPLASIREDKDATALIEQWILSLGSTSAQTEWVEYE